MRSRGRAVGMCEITALGDFQGLWEGWETDSFIVGLPCFPSGRHFHRGRRRDFRFVIRPVKPTRVLLVSALCAVSHPLRYMLDVLLRFHRCECMAQTLVLDDGCVTDPLVLAEDAIGKRVPFPSHLERPISEVVDLDVLACQLVCQLTPLEDDLSAIVGEGKLLAEATLLAMAQDVSQTGRLHVQPAVHVRSLRCGNGELLVESLHEL